MLGYCRLLPWKPMKKQPTKTEKDCESNEKNKLPRRKTNSLDQTYGIIDLQLREIRRGLLQWISSRLKEKTHEFQDKDSTHRTLTWNRQKQCGGGL